MKKSELVKAIMEKVEGVTAEKVGQCINATFEAIAEALEKGDSYNQDKFGTFKTQDREARKGRNPQTGETVDIPKKKAVKLVVSGRLKDKINKEEE